MAKLSKDEQFNIITEAQEAKRKGNDEAATNLLKQLPLAPPMAMIYFHRNGREALLNANFNLDEANKAFGENWTHTPVKSIKEAFQIMRKSGVING